MELNNNILHSNSADYLYMICREYPLLVIATECATGKYSFNRIGYRRSKMMLEFNLIMDEHYKDTKSISDNLGKRYYLTVDQFLNAYRYFAIT